MGTPDEKTTRFVVIDPSFINLEENNYNREFVATDPGAKRMTKVIDARSSPDKRVPAMPASGAFCRRGLSQGTPGVDFGGGAIREVEKCVQRKRMENRGIRLAPAWRLERET